MYVVNKLQEMRQEARSLNRSRTRSSSLLVDTGLDRDVAGDVVGDVASDDQLAPSGGQLSTCKECPNRVLLDDDHFAISESLVDSARQKIILMVVEAG